MCISFLVLCFFWKSLFASDLQDSEHGGPPRLVGSEKCKFLEVKYKLYSIVTNMYICIFKFIMFVNLNISKLYIQYICSFDLFVWVHLFAKI